MTAETIAEAEALAGEQAHRVLDLIGAGRREELVAYVNSIPPAELALVLLAVSQGLLEQEARCDELEVRCGILTAQNRTLEEGNAQLFRERRVLTEKLEEWRHIGAARRPA